MLNEHIFQSESSLFESRREFFCERLKLREQWDSQRKILAEVGILEILPESHSFGIVGIDGKEYPLPRYEEIVSRITSERLEFLEKKYQQGFTKLLLVSLAMPLDILIDRYRRVLLKHHQQGKLLATDGTPLLLDTEKPIWIWEKYPGADLKAKEDPDALIYFIQEFNRNPQIHQGKSKQELIEQGEAWQFILVEDLPDLPAQEKGKTIDGRKQLEANQTPINYLKELQTNPQYQGEQGLIPESWLTYAITHLKETNQQIDDWQGQGKTCFLIGAFLSGLVPHCFWYRAGQRAGLGRSDPGDSYSTYGARAAVKI